LNKLKAIAIPGLIQPINQFNIMGFIPPDLTVKYLEKCKAVAINNNVDIGLPSGVNVVIFPV